MRSFLMSGLACLLLSQYAAAAPIAVSSYAYDTSGWLPHSNAAYTDNGYNISDQSPTPTELTNGVLGTTVPSPFSDSQWVGIGPDNDADDGLVQPGLTFDLGTLYELDSLSIHYLSDHPSNGSGVRAPDSVDISFSEDGITYSTPITFTGFLNQEAPFVGTLAFTANVDLTGFSGRFARLEFLNDSPWTFLSEIQFEGNVSQVIPEPSTLVLLGLGLSLMLRKHRRHRAV